MRTLIEQLCSHECAGRRPGTPGGDAARRIVRDAFRDAGLDPREQPVPGCGGANVLARIPGDIDRFILVGAHFDHLGTVGRHVFHGADDNAAAVAILVEVARALANERTGRGVIIAAFDGEEPPHFMSGAMGSREFVRTNRDPIDFMVCMDLVGHALGGEGLPDEVRASVFALGAERSTGTARVVDATRVPGLHVRRADAEIIPPLSDYEAFWKKRVPFLFLTAGRSARYHTPADTPEHLDYEKMDRTASWVEGFVRGTCARDDRIAFDAHARDDRSTLESFAALVTPLAAVSSTAEDALDRARSLLARCDARGRLPDRLAGEPSDLVLGLEGALA